MDALNPVRSLADQAYEALLDAICTGELKPGDRLAQDEIAQRLRVSRQPVNSALAMLKAQRFVQDTGRRGVVVAPVDPALFTEIYQLRSAVEPLAVELATPRLDPQAREEGRAVIVRGRSLVAEGQAADVLQADVDFHLLICRLSGNRMLEETMRLHWQHLRRAMGEVLRHPGMSAQVWDEHATVWEAMAKGDAAAAAAAMRAHIVGAPPRIRA
jgi:DNA-binding GntR family transcriptional regulator